jgi:DNA-binding transcriptional LysR family regulator
MQLAVLRYFLAVAELGSIRQAAEQLHVAASAVSRQIANLEYDYGVPLFERHAQGMRLTLAGEIFAQHARTTLREFERVRSDIDDVRGLKRGNVRIAAVEGVVSNFLFTAIAEFGTQYPNVTFDVNVAGTAAILDSIARDEAELGIAFNPVPHPDVAMGSIIKHPLVAIVPPNHPLAERKSVELSDLTGFEVATLHPSFGTRQILDRALIEADVRLEALLTINSIEMLKAFVARGLGVSVIPLFAVAREQDDRELVAVAIDNDALRESHLALCWRKERELGAATEAFRAHIERELQVFFAQD